jgi:hypothetical protein
VHLRPAYWPQLHRRLTTLSSLPCDSSTCALYNDRAHKVLSEVICSVWHRMQPCSEHSLICIVPTKPSLSRENFPKFDPPLLRARLSRDILINAGSRCPDLRRCEYECNAGYFGHPERDGVCVQCPDLMALNQETLPQDGYWPTSPAGGVCNENSWECSNGLLKSNLTKFCCALQQDVPNSQPDPDYSPCQYSCKLGYR